MKKIYQNPEIKIVKVETSKILAGSSEETLNYGGSTTKSSGNLSRDGGDFWDDDDE